MGEIIIWLEQLSPQQVWSFAIIASMLVISISDYLKAKRDVGEANAARDELLLNYEKLLYDLDELKEEKDTLKNEIEYQRKLNKVAEAKDNTHRCNAKDRAIIATALKKAMVQSHPDKNQGKDTGAFTEYSRLYKIYK